jgi:serine protease Do
LIPTAAYAGVIVENLTPQLAQFFGAKQGVLVRSVRVGSRGAAAGFQAGDVITTVESKTVASAQEWLRLIKSSSSNQVRLEIVRNKRAKRLTFQKKGH